MTNVWAHVLLQAVSTMIRVGVSPLILLINNSGYVIEEEIHSGPYNKISDWNYTAVVEGMAGSRKNLYTAKVYSSQVLPLQLVHLWPCNSCMSARSKNLCTWVGVCMVEKHCCWIMQLLLHAWQTVTILSQYYRN